MAGQRFAIIRVDLDTKEVTVLGQTSGGPPVNVDDKAGGPPTGAEKLGEVYWAQSSPGCVYWVNGIPVKVC